MIEMTLGIAKDVLVSVLGSFVYDKLTESHKQALAADIAREVASQLRQQPNLSQMQVLSATRRVTESVVPHFQVQLIRQHMDDADRLTREADALLAEINAKRWVIHPGWVQIHEQQRAGLLAQRQECLSRAERLIFELGRR